MLGEETIVSFKKELRNAAFSSLYFNICFRRKKYSKGNCSIQQEGVFIFPVIAHDVQNRLQNR